MKITRVVEVCDYKGCGNDKGLVTCYKCGMKVCVAHRLEGEREGKAIFLCWMDMPVALV